jgi:hypothetical protein
MPPLTPLVAFCVLSHFSCEYPCVCTLVYVHTCVYTYVYTCVNDCVRLGTPGCIHVHRYNYVRASSWVGNNLGAEGAQHLGNGLAHVPLLQSLNLWRTCRAQSTFILDRSSMSVHRGVAVRWSHCACVCARYSMASTGNQLGDDGVCDLAAKLTSVPLLRSLNLQCTFMTKVASAFRWWQPISHTVAVRCGVF